MTNENNGHISYEDIFRKAQAYQGAIAAGKFAQDENPRGMKKSLDRVIQNTECDSEIRQMLEDYGEKNPEEAVKSVSDIYHSFEGRLKVKDLPRFYEDAIDAVVADEKDKEAAKELFSDEYFGDQTLAELHKEVMESQSALRDQYASREEKEKAREYMQNNQRKMIALQSTEQLGLIQSGVYEMEKESAVGNLRELFGRYRPNAEQ